MNTRITFTVIVLASVMLFTACTSATSGITVKDAWARPTAAQMQATPTEAMGINSTMTSTSSMNAMDTGPVSAVYLTISNSSNKSDKLIKVSATIADVAEVHETKQMDNGMTGMQPVQGGLEIPANGTVALKPGGYHIMLMKLHQDLVAGQTFSMTLNFQSGQQMTLNVPVKAAQ